MSISRPGHPRVLRGMAVAFFLAVCCSLGFAARGLAAISSTRIVTLRFSPEELRWASGPDGFVPMLPETVPAAVPGELRLPLISCTVLPPPGTRLEAVTLVARREVAVAPPGALARFLPGEADRVAPAAAGLVRVPVTRTPGGYCRGERRDAFVVSPLAAGADGWRLSVEMELELRFVPDAPGDVVLPRRGKGGREMSPPAGKIFDFEGASAPRLGTASPEASRAVGEPFSPRFRPSLDGSPVVFVIVTNEAMRPEFERLAAWRTRSGVPTVVRTMGWILDNYRDGPDVPARLRSFLRDAVTSWGTESVLLAGDTPVIPVRYARTTFYLGEEIPTDMYYQCLDGSWNANGNDRFAEGLRSTPTFRADDADLIPDLWIGRLPVSNPAQAKTAVDKILTYEVHPPVADDYPASALMLAEVLFPQDWRPGRNILIDGAGMAESTRTRITENIRIRRLYENSGEFPGAEPEEIETVIDAIDRGYGIVHHVGHGFHDNIAVGLDGHSLFIPDVDAFDNGPRYFVFYAINCTSSAVDFDAIGEHILNNPMGGSVAGVGSTRFDFPGTSQVYDVEFYRLLFAAGVTRLGEAAARAKVPFVPFAAADNAHRWTQFTLIYLGDPTLRIWTRRPETLSATFPDTVSFGETTVQVTVAGPDGPASGARVTLYKEGEVFASGRTDAAGAVSLTIRPRTEGTLSVVATAVEHLPVEGEIPVVDRGGAYPILDAVVVDDTGSPEPLANGHLDAGETATVTFSLVNAGSTGLTGVTVTPATDGGRLTLDPLDWSASIDAGETASYRFTAAAAAGVADLSRLPVTLGVTADQGTWSVPALVDVGAIAPAIFRLDVLEFAGDGDGIVEGGEEIRLRPVIENRGTGAAGAMTGRIAFLDAAGAVLTGPEAAYDGFAAGDTTSPADGGFALILGSGSRRPTLEFTLNDGDGVHLRATLDLVPPAPPTGFAAAGSPATIRITWVPSPSPDVLRYVVERSTSAEGPYTRLSRLDKAPTAFYEDGPVPPVSIRFYRVAAQDSSGNLSVFSPPVRGTTSRPLAPNFPLESTIGTTTSPLVADLDGDGVLEVIAGGNQVYAFHGDATELRDGDQDARTLGPWTGVATQRGFWASPAAGDADGDGRLEVAAISFTEGWLYLWDRNGVLLPGWPRTTGRPDQTNALGGPVLTDLTGDGKLEVVVHADRAVYAYDSHGEEVIDGDGDPGTDGVFFTTGSSASYATVTPTDVDGDGKSELVVATRAGTLHFLNGDGSERAGFPITFDGPLISSPAIADLDGDGAVEIIFGTGADSLEVLHVDGTRAAGWPQSVLMNQDVMSSPAVADVDGDGSLEIAVVSGNTKAHLWHADGTEVEGFPVRFQDSLGGSIAARGSPALADLDGDDELEFVFSTQVGSIFALQPDGTQVDGFPLKVDGVVEGGVLVYDLDGDGTNELCFVGLDGKYYVYETAGKAGGRPGWPMFHHDPRRSGRAGAPILDGRTPRVFAAVLQSPELPGRASLYAVSSRPPVSTPEFLLDDVPLAAEGVDGGRALYRATAALVPGSHRFSVRVTTADGFSGEAERNFEVLGAAPAGGRVESADGSVRIVAGERGGGPSALLIRRGGEGPAPAGFEPPGDGIRFLVGPGGVAVPPGTVIEFSIPSTWVGGRAARWDGRAWRPVAGWVSEPGRLAVDPERFGWFRLREGAAHPGPVLSRIAAAPNPFTARTRIGFVLAGDDHVRVDVFDVRGTRVRRVADRRFAAGEREVVWDGTREGGAAVPPGIYFLRVSGSTGSAVRKIVRLRGGDRR